MSSPVATEKRRSYRAQVEIPVAYRLEGEVETHSGVAKNVSAGGMRIVGEAPFAPQQVAYVRFALPNELVQGVRFEREVEQRTLRTRVRKRLRVPPAPFGEMRLPVKLVSTTRDGHGDTAVSGVEFVGLDSALREELHRFVHVLQLNELRERADARRYYRDLNRA